GRYEPFCREGVSAGHLLPVLIHLKERGGCSSVMSKVMELREAVGRFVFDGAVVGLGGQNIGRCAMATVHEIIR
ncbi:MAG: hypothetical protein ACE5G5_08915, partial [Candidatus Methylomirabilales bacterium]